MEIASKFTDPKTPIRRINVITPGGAALGATTRTTTCMSKPKVESPASETPATLSIDSGFLLDESTPFNAH